MTMPNVDPNQRRRNVLLLVILAAFAGLLYLGVMLDMANHGF